MNVFVAARAPILL